MFKLNKKHFYIIEAPGANDAQRRSLKAILKAKGIDCEVVRFSIEMHQVEKK